MSSLTDEKEAHIEHMVAKSTDGGAYRETIHELLRSRAGLLRMEGARLEALADSLPAKLPEAADLALRRLIERDMAR